MARGSGMFQLSEKLKRKRLKKESQKKKAARLSNNEKRALYDRAHVPVSFYDQDFELRLKKVANTGGKD